MANNVMQILRSPTTATPASLLPGQLAYSNAVGGSGILYIGSTDGATVVPIGGVRNPGTLTANQSLVANSTSGINSIQTGNLVLVGTSGTINANGSTGTAGYVLFSGGTANAYWASLTTNTAAQYTWSNTQTFQNTITFSTQILANAINATSYTAGVFGSATSGFLANSTEIAVGNSTVNGTITSNSTVTYFTGTAYTANNATNLNGQPASYYSNASNLTGTVNTSLTFPTYLVNTSSSFTLAGNTTLNGTNTVIGSNVTITGANLNVTGTNSYFTSNQYFGGTSHDVVANATFSGANVSITGTNTYISSNVTFTGGLISATSSNVSVQNMNVSGNLIVSGTVVSINVATLVVNDNIIELGDNNTTTDVVDTGWFSPAGNSSSIWYSGLVRQAAKSTNNAPYFWLFGSNTNPNTATTVDTSANSGTAYLQAYLLPYGTGGAFVANSTVVNITANSTVSSTLTVNSVALATALLATYGGTGVNTYSAGDLLYAGTTNPTALSKLSVPGSAANGQVLQISNNLPSWNTLDGGVF
jgi:hypothetical protein